MNRPLAIAALALAMLAGAALNAAFAARSGNDDPGVLRAQSIELVDGGGRARARLNVEHGGEVVLRMFAADGEVRVKLGASSDGSGLLLLNEATEPGVQMIAREGAGAIMLSEGADRQVIRP